MFEPEPWHPARPGLWRPGPLDPTGEHGPTRSQSQSSKVRGTTRGLYLPAHVERTTNQRIVEGSMVMQPGHALTGWANLRWRGGRWFTGVTGSGHERPIDILISTHDIRPRPGIAVCGEGISPDLVEDVDGIQLVDVRSAVAFLMRYAGSVGNAVQVLDMAAYDDLVSIDEMTDFIIPGQNSMTGVPKAREALTRANENAWSPAEVDMREVWTVIGERPMPLANAPVFDLGGHHLATPDLLDPEAGVGGEYESLFHLQRETRSKDVGREGLLVGHGLEMVTMTADDRHDPTAFLYRLAAAYARADRRRDEPRRWTVQPPPWWTPTTTVAMRRALTPEQRARFLRYRAS